MEHESNNAFDFLIKTAAGILGLYLFYKLIITLFEIAFL